MPTRCWRRLKPLQDKLFNEIVGRIKQDDSQRPGPRARLLLLHALRRGADYPIVAAQGAAA